MEFGRKILLISREIENLFRKKENEWSSFVYELVYLMENLSMQEIQLSIQSPGLTPIKTTEKPLEHLANLPLWDTELFVNSYARFIILE